MAFSRSARLMSGVHHGMYLSTLTVPKLCFDKMIWPIERSLNTVSDVVFWSKLMHELDKRVVAKAELLDTQQKESCSQFYGLARIETTGRYIKPHEWDRFGSIMPKDNREMNQSMRQSVENFNDPANRKCFQINLLEQHVYNGTCRFAGWRSRTEDSVTASQSDVMWYFTSTFISAIAIASLAMFVFASLYHQV